MPNRWIKAAYCTSPRIHAVGPEARDFWVRLVVNADDHGYFHGGAQLVASACFPLQPNARKCEQLLAELSTAQLIVRYESGGKQYLAITQWYERPRSLPKYPPPTGEYEQALAIANNGAQLKASASLHDHDHDHVHTTATTTFSAPSEKISLDAAGWVGVSELDRDTWKAAFPAVDIDGELAKARAWVIANPAQKKSNWRRFLNGWLSRRQDKGTPRSSGQKSGRAKVNDAIWGERGNDAIDGTAERVA